MVSRALLWSQNPLTENGLSQLLAYFSVLAVVISSKTRFLQEEIEKKRERTQSIPNLLVTVVQRHH